MAVKKKKNTVEYQNSVNLSCCTVVKKKVLLNIKTQSVYQIVLRLKKKKKIVEYQDSISLSNSVAVKNNIAEYQNSISLSNNVAVKI